MQCIRFCYTTLTTRHYISFHESFQHICQRTATCSRVWLSVQHYRGPALFIRERCRSCHFSISKSLWPGSFRGRSQLYAELEFCYTRLITRHYISVHESFQHICQQTAMRSNCANGAEYGSLYSSAEFLCFPFASAMFEPEAVI